MSAPSGHRELAAGRWRTMPLVETMANVGSEVTRARELFCGLHYPSAPRADDAAYLEKYFFHFAVAARRARERRQGAMP